MDNQTLLREEALFCGAGTFGAGTGDNSTGGDGGSDGDGSGGDCGVWRGAGAGLEVGCGALVLVVLGTRISTFWPASQILTTIFPL